MFKRPAGGLFLLLSSFLLSGVILAAAPSKAPISLKNVTKARYPGADAVVVLDETRVDVEESGLSHVNRTQLIKVLTEKGAAKYATMRFDYDPASSFAEVKELTVFRKDGTLEKIPHDRIYDLPQPQYMIYWGPRMKLCSIPKLNPGDAVEIKTYSKGFVIAYLRGTDDSKYIPPMRGHYYDTVIFQGELPIVKKKYTITLPKDKPIRAQVYNGKLASSVFFDSNKLVYSWWNTNVPAVKREPKMVEDRDCLPKLVLATVPDWPTKSRWFYKVNEDAHAFQWNNAIKAKVDEITKGLKTDDQKRFALLAWVARNIRYSGISMGKGEGYTLHPGIMTFNDRAGVCKDIAGMLITMFRAAGFTHTYPAMTMAGARVEEVPADQFNHCVVATEIAPDKYKLYDPTWCPFSREIWSSAEKPQNYDIGSPRGEELMETPKAPAEDNFVNVKANESLQSNGSLTGTLRITAGHYSETNLRWGMLYGPAYRLREDFQRRLSHISPLAKLTGFSTTDVLDVNTPLVITLKYEIPSYAITTGNTIVFTPTLAKNIAEGRRLTDFFAAVGGKEREYDIFIRATRAFTFTESLNLPKGFVVEGTPKAVNLDGPAASFSTKASATVGKFLFTEKLAVKKKIIKADEYPNLRKAVKAAQKAENTLVVLKKRGA